MAATVLGVTQPALTKSVQALEAAGYRGDARALAERAGQGCPECGAPLPMSPGFLVKSPTTFGLTTRALAIATFVIIGALLALRMAGCFG